MPENYYTPCNVGIYIGGYRLSDAFRVDWDARDSKTPLYGWADDTFKAVSNGRKIITGRLVINYRYPGYLTAAIAEYQNQQSPIDTRKINNDLNEFLSLDTTDRVVYIAKIAAKNYGDDRLGEFRTAQDVSYSAAYKVKDTFDILIAYGDIQEEDHIEVVIKDAYIVGQSQVISASATGGGDVSSSGSPIYEIYSFFAKEIVESVHPARRMPYSPTASQTVGGQVQ
jgi:hypothetical protein